MGQSEEMAKDRTDWAEDRTIMANERTFASWLGGGMGAIGLALAFKAVFGDFEPTWIARAVALIPLLAAIVLFWSARRKACQTIDRLTEREVEASGTKTFTVITALMIATAIGTGFILWFV
ncbi:MAG: DUF202 domain-containing protein [Pseudomonadota bacterium]